MFYNILNILNFIKISSPTFGALDVKVISLLQENTISGMAITLNNESKLSIQKVTGLTYEEILSMDSEQINEKIEKKIGKKLKFKSITDKRLPSRGSVYLFLNRFFDFDKKNLDKFIDSISIK